MGYRICRYICFCFMMVLFGTTYLWADVTGSMRGYVRDNSGAVIPNATVAATLISTNTTRTVKSDASGQYSLLALFPGAYRLTATAPGFEQGVIDQITLNVNDALTFSFTLTIGNVTQSVTVNATALQVETSATSTGSTISTNQILAMPLNGRSYLDLLALQPGVAPANTNGSYNSKPPASGLYGSAGNQSTDGQPEWANAFLVNGAEVDETQNMGAGMIPDADSVAEFHLLTNGYSAEYGKFTGSVMNTVTKSGTNAIHGTLFEFYRNQRMDAFNYFDSKKAELKRHQYGGVAGGPIWKNHLFTFGDYQQTHQVAGISTGIVQVMSDDQRSGIFADDLLSTYVQGTSWAATLASRGGGTVVGQSASCPGPPACTPTMYNQLGTATTTKNAKGLSVPAHNISALMDPVSKLTIGAIPKANQSDGYGYNSAATGTITNTNWAERIDFHNVMTGDWMFYYHYDGTNALQPVYIDPNQTGVWNLPGFPNSAPARSQLFTMSNTKTIGATAVNVARAQLFRWQEQSAQPAASSTISGYDKLGFNTNPATGGLVNTGPPGYPSSMPAYFFNTFSVGNDWLNLYQPETNYGVEDTFSKVAGSHSISFGGTYRYYILNVRNTCGPNGYFDFNGVETNSDGADFFIGAPIDFVQCSVQLLDNRTSYWGLFAQDSWKATPTLTLNYGLRVDVPRAWSDRWGRLTTPVPGVQSTKFPDSPLGNLVPGDPGVPDTISPTRYDNFGPRVGIAWAPTGGIFGAGQTSIRAAFGIYYLGAADNGNFGVIGDAPWGLYWGSPQSVQMASPYVTRSTGISQGQHFPFTFPSGPGPFPNFKFGSLLPLYVPGYYPKNKVQMAEHWNLSVQRQFGRETVANLNYVGTAGHHIQMGKDIILGDGPLCLSIPGCGPGGEGGVYTVGGKTYYGTMTGPIDNQTISPKYHDSNGGPVVAYADASWNINAGNSNYHSLQASLEHRAADLTFLLAYTYGKSLDNVGAKFNPRNPRQAYGQSSYDLRHNFVASYSWMIPFQRFLGHNRASEGWQISGISRFNTGFPFSVKSGGDKALTNRGVDFPNQVSGFKKLDPRAAGHHYFDKTMFASNLSCGYETCGVTGTAKQFAFHGPGSIHTDAGLEKDTRINDRMSVNFRLEMFNVFNHVNFTAVSGNANSGSFGNVTNTAQGRVGQLSGKFVF